MLRLPRLLPGAAALAAAIAIAPALVSASDLGQRKIDRVQRAIEKTAARPAADWQTRAAGAHALLAVAAEDGVLRFTATGHAGASVFALDGGKKIVVDLTGAIDLTENAPATFDAIPGVKDIKISQYSVTPGLVARVVIRLAEAHAHETAETASGIDVRLTPKNHPGAEPLLIEFRDDAAHAPGTALEQHLAALRGVPAAPAASADVDAIASYLGALTTEPAPARAAAPQPAALAGGLAAVAAKDIDLFTFRAQQTGALSDDGGGDEAMEKGPLDSAEPAPAAEAPAASEEAPAAEAPADAAEAAAPVEEQPEPPAPREAPEPVDTTAANAELVRTISEVATEAPAAVESVDTPRAYSGDPMAQLVNIDFREMELSNVVALLAAKAGINVIAGTELSGIVTANLRNVPLRQAMETVLRMNDLGLLEEEGIYRIVSYGESIAAQRESVVVELQNAKADDMQKVLREIVVGSPDDTLINIAADKTANVLIISGPKSKIVPLLTMASRLDVAEPVLPTVTEAIKLNYAGPQEILTTVSEMLTEKIGTASADERARHLIVTDVPVVVESIRDLVKKLDIPVKQVAIDAMVVDVNLKDGAETGVDWLVSAVQDQSRSQAVLGTDAEGNPIGRAIGTLQDIGLAANMAGNPLAGVLNFGLLTDNINWGGIIQAEVRAEKGRLLSNPVLVTLENQPALIDITQEIPYVEVKETNAGGSQTNTEFKNIGTILEVTPRVTHDDDILVDVSAKESGTAGEFNGIPIEDKRQIQTNLRVPSGRTIFIGGLRKQNNDRTTRKIPVLGDVPVFNFLFRQNIRSEQVNELLIFLTCSVLKDSDELTPYQRARLSEGNNIEVNVDAQSGLFHSMVYPHQEDDPLWKWRRSE